MIKEQLKYKLQNLPDNPGCYLMKNRLNIIIYVGKAKNLKKRVNQYFVGAHDYKTTKLVSAIVDLDFIITNTEKEALLLEFNLIKKYKPRYNIIFIDDKSYPYIKLTNEKYPQLIIARDAKRDKKSKYFGPYPDVTSARKTLKLIHELFPLRKCRNMGKKVCLYYHLNQCLGPCEYEVSPLEYQKLVDQAIRFLNGDTKNVQTILIKQMNDSVKQLNFERAQLLKELLDSINNTTAKTIVNKSITANEDYFAYYFANGYLAISGLFVRNGNLIDKTFKIFPLNGNLKDEFTSFIMQYYDIHPMSNLLCLPEEIDDLKDLYSKQYFVPQKGQKKELIRLAQKNAKKQLDLKFAIVNEQIKQNDENMDYLSRLLGKEIYRIELFDNSHISGTNSVAAMVCFDNGKPNKTEYRLFKLHTKNSDVDSMKEVLYRRYYDLLMKNKVLPDLIIVDGGIQQINAAVEIITLLDLDIKICGLVKDNHHNTAGLLNQNLEQIPIDAKSSLFFLLTNMQDEVHRFAINYHRKLRSKQQTASILDEINGVGVSRKKALYQKFKSISKIKEANVVELSEVVPQSIAQNIYDFFHQ